MAKFIVDFPDAVLPNAIEIAAESLTARGVQGVDKLQPYEAVGQFLALYLADATRQRAANVAQASVQATLDAAAKDAKTLAEQFNKLTITPVS